MTVLGIWLPFRAGGSLGPPEELPLGRAALALEQIGVAVVIGRPENGGFVGVRAEPGRWISTDETAVDGVYDRFPSQSRPDEFARGLQMLGQTLVVNPPALTALCRDKLRCQRALEVCGVGMPPVEGDLERFEYAVSTWGAAFLKPREGSFGHGVRRVRSGESLPSSGSWVLQRAIEPPDGWAGVSVRVLCQQSIDGEVVVRSGVARRSRLDPVVNAARGADLAPCVDVLLPNTVEALHELCVHTMAALMSQADGEHLVEAGLDAVIDREGRPWLIEVNSRPRGRLRELAKARPARFLRAHALVCASPLHTLASWVSN
ncbi:MAG: glutathione synthase/RimK-type ligase-like ATP-grasp enzyme [Kiritimatiellia bacterium]|jgi:glutathione synthase/RimK-type ligase-like ATP-grasp enzyme